MKSFYECVWEWSEIAFARQIPCLAFLARAAQNISAFFYAPHNMNYLKWISKINYKMNVPKVGDILYVILF